MIEFKGNIFDFSILKYQKEKAKKSHSAPLLRWIQMMDQENDTEFRK